MSYLAQGSSLQVYTAYSLNGEAQGEDSSIQIFIVVIDDTADIAGCFTGGGAIASIHENLHGCLLAVG